MPSQEHVFSVENFEALKDIQNQLKEKIFAIEGEPAMKLLASGPQAQGFSFLNLDPHELDTNPC